MLKQTCSKYFDHLSDTKSVRYMIFIFWEPFEEEFTVVFGQLGSVHTFLIIDPRCAAAFFIQMNSAHTVNEDSDRKAITVLQCKFD